MRKACKIAAIVLAACLLAGCATQPTEGSSDHKSIYRVVEGGGLNSYVIIYDVHTGVMYNMSNGGHNGGTLTLLVNADGTPRVWVEWEE